MSGSNSRRRNVPSLGVPSAASERLPRLPDPALTLTSKRPLGADGGVSRLRLEPPRGPARAAPCPAPRRLPARCPLLGDLEAALARRPPRGFPRPFCSSQLSGLVRSAAAGPLAWPFCSKSFSYSRRSDAHVYS